MNSELSIISFGKKVYSAASGALLGIATTRSWGGAIAGPLVAVTLNPKRNPHLNALSSIAYAAINSTFRNYICDSHLLSSFLSAIPFYVFNKELGHDLGTILDMSLCSHYFISLIDYVGRYHLGKGVAFASAAVVGSLFLMKQQSTLTLCKELDASGYLLSDEFLEKAKSYIDSPERLSALPRPLYGKSTVYFLDDLVLKQTEDTYARFEKMGKAKLICQQNDYESLVIPQARVYEDFLIEKRLPIGFPRIKEQIGLYLENLDRFTTAVQEFTGFLFQATLHCMVGECEDPCSSITSHPMGRYDNICLFMIEGVGKIGLVDLERLNALNIPANVVPLQKTESRVLDLKRKIYQFLIRASNISIHNPDIIQAIQPYHQYEKIWDTIVSVTCHNAVCLFPHHLNEILGVAEKFSPIPAKLRVDLQSTKNKTLEKFQGIYRNHLLFCQEKGISIYNPAEIAWPSAVQIELIQKSLEAKLRKIPEKRTFFKFRDFNPYKEVLGNDKEFTIKRFNEELFPAILKNTLLLLEEQIKSSNEKRLPESMVEVLSDRSFSLEGAFFDHFIQEIASKISMFNLPGREAALENQDLSKYFAKALIHFLLEELVHAKVLAYFNPSLGINEKPYIFC